MTLEALHLSPTCLVVLERAALSHQFSEWNPHDMTIRLLLALPDTDSPPPSLPSLLPGNSSSGTLSAEEWVEGLPSAQVVVSEKGTLSDLRTACCAAAERAARMVGGASLPGALGREFALILLARRSAGVGGAGHGEVLRPSMLLGGRGGRGEDSAEAVEGRLGEGGWGLQDGDRVLLEVLADGDGHVEGPEQGGRSSPTSSILAHLLESENRVRLTCHAPKALLRGLLMSTESGAREAGGVRAVAAEGAEAGDAGKTAGALDAVEDEGDAVGSVALDLRWSLARAKQAVLQSLAARLSTSLPLAARLGSASAPPSCHQGPVDSSEVAVEGSAQVRTGGQVAAGVSERAVAEVAGRVHVRKTSKGAQIKNETKALSELGLAAGSLLFVRLGAPRSLTQKSLKVFIAASAAGVARPLLALTVEESWTCAELKSALAIRLSKSKDKAVAAGAATAFRV